MRKPGLVHEGVPQNVVKTKRLQRGRRDALREGESVIQLPDAAAAVFLCPGAGVRSSPGGGELYPCHPTSGGFASPWVVSVVKHIPHNMKGCVF